MKVDTPLSEVAAYLPRGSAVLLTEEPAYVQQTVLECVRATMVTWEELGHQIDPIALDTALSGFVPVMIRLTRLCREHIDNLKVRLQAADILIESLGQSLAQIATEARES